MRSACRMTQFLSSIVQAGYCDRYCDRSKHEILSITKKTIVMNLNRILWYCEAPHSIIWFLGSTAFTLLKQPSHTLVLMHQSITLNKIAIYSFHTGIYQWSINPLQWSAAPSQPNPAPDPLLSSATPLGVSCYYAWGSRTKSFSPSVSVSDSAHEWAWAVDLSYPCWNPVYALYRRWAVQFKKCTTLWNQTPFSLLETTINQGTFPTFFFSYQLQVFLCLPYSTKVPKNRPFFFP